MVAWKRRLIFRKLLNAIPKDPQVLHSHHSLCLGTWSLSHLCTSALNPDLTENLLGKLFFPGEKCLCTQKLHTIPKATHGYLDP